MPRDAFTGSPPPSLRLRTARIVCSRLPPLISQRIRDRIYPRSVARLEACRFTTNSLTGSPFSGTTADHVAHPFAVHGYFNWRNVVIARGVCRPGDVIYDIGANIGSETVGFSDIVGRGGAVYAFEPFPANLDQLRHNAATTRSANVEVLALALSDSSGELRFAAPAEGNSGSGHVIESSAGGEHGAVIVACRTLDEVRTEIRRPRLLVVDAEGHEAAILRGADRVLRDDRPVIVLEALAELLARAGSDPATLARYLHDRQYVLAEISRFGLAPFDATATIPHASDWLALPREEMALTGRIRRLLRLGAAMPCLPGLNPLCAGAPA